MTLLLLLGCHADPVPDEGVADTDERATAYDDTRVLEVALTLGDGDWEALRGETRSLWDIFGGDCLAEPFESPFSWYAGDATVDGVHLGTVRVRKKGFLGSLESARPSLKLDLGRGVHGVTRLTLNNGREDPTGLRTCLAYKTYAAAGVPAPRCTLAHVIVNGEDLGVYANVEPIDENFLTRRGFSPDGALFEGTLSDFREGWTGTFDPETESADVADLHRVVEAVDSSDLDLLSDAVDLDAYLDFWAAEVLVGQWDGYSANTNNFFVYDDPSTGLIRLLPWGPDAAFDSDAASVRANAALAQAVLVAPGGEEAYLAHVTALLDDVWDGDAMAEEVDRLADLADPWQGDEFRADVGSLRAFVEGRADAIRAELVADPTVSTGALRETPCFVERGSIATTFSTTWDTLGRDPWTTGSTTMAVTWDGVPLTMTSGGAIAGAQGDTAVAAAYASRSDGSYLVSYAYLSVDALAPGRFPFDFVDVVGVLLYSNGTSGPGLAAYVAEGEVTFDAAGSSPGDVVSGRIDGKLVAYGW